MDFKLEDLKKPMPFKWKVQTANANGCQMVAYIDSRQAQDVLNGVVGADNWQSKFEQINNHLFCSVGILCGNEWVWKTDVGTESDIEGIKGEASDAFKRACVHWGIGRFLYDLKAVRTPSANNIKGKPAPARRQGDSSTVFKPWEKDELNDYCMAIYNGKKPTADDVVLKLASLTPEGFILDDARVREILKPLYNGDATIPPLDKIIAGFEKKYSSEIYIEDPIPYDGVKQSA